MNIQHLLVLVAIIVVTYVIFRIAAGKPIFFPEPQYRKIPAPNNYPGVPPEHITWEDAGKYVFASITPMTSWEVPTHCPKCGKELLEHKSAYTEYQMDGKSFWQYDVRGVYCPDGHYTNLDCA